MVKYTFCFVLHWSVYVDFSSSKMPKSFIKVTLSMRESFKFIQIILKCSFTMFNSFWSIWQSCMLCKNNDNWASLANKLIENRVVCCCIQRTGKSVANARVDYRCSHIWYSMSKLVSEMERERSFVFTANTHSDRQS